MSLVVGAASACSSGGGSGTAGGPSARGLTGDPVVLYSINILNGQVGTEPEIPVATKAAVAAINAAGGVQGRPLKVVNCDDSPGQNADAACARKAVADHALAVVGASSAFGDTYVPIVTAAGIPVIGPIPNSVAELSAPLSFPLTSNAASLAAAAILMVKLRCQHIKTMAANVSVVQFTLKSGFTAPLTRAGGHIDAVVSPPLTATDLSPYVSQLASNSDCVFPLSTGDQAKIVATDLAQSNYTGKFVFGTLQWSQKDITELGDAAKNVYLSGGEADATDTSVPGIQQFNREVDGSGNTSVSRDLLMVNMWTSIHLVADLAQTVRPLTAKGLIAALKAKPVSYRGVVGPVDFAHPNTTFAQAPQVTYNTLQKIYKVVDGKLTPIFDGKFVDVLDPSSWPSP